LHSNFKNYFFESYEQIKFSLDETRIVTIDVYNQLYFLDIQTGIFQKKKINAFDIKWSDDHSS
jgi:hypothetical protein